MWRVKYSSRFSPPFQPGWFVPQRWPTEPNGLRRRDETGALPSGWRFAGRVCLRTSPGLSMNNLNDPPHWNIRPNARDDDGQGSKWNYALLVPMLGLAAFRWIWSRESQKEIEKEKKNYYQKLTSAQRELEFKYRDIITENRRTVAHLELELEKEQKRTQSYRQALVSQSHKLVEERRALEQEQRKLEEEKQILQHSGAAGALYQNCLEKEEEWQKKATALLKDCEDALTKRQDIYCSLVVPRHQRLEVEKQLLIRAATDPVALDLEMEAGLNDIFRYDTYCSNLLNTNKRRNGKLMWLYLRYWELSAELKKFKRVEKVMLGR